MPYSERTTTRAPASCMGDQLTANGVDSLEVLAEIGMVRAESLEAVIQVWEIDQRQGRAVLVEYVSRCIGDPAGRDDVGRRPPEIEEGKGPSVEVRSLRNSRGSV